jgi:hypothetical protein
MDNAKLRESRPRPLKLRRYRSVQVNFRVSSKWLRIVSMLAKLEGRSSSALMRELLTLGLAQYVNIHYRTPQLIRQQQLQSIITSQLPKAAAEGKANAAKKNPSIRLNETEASV